MTQIAFAAIDGGATKTVLRLVTPEGVVLAEGRGGPANIASDAGRASHSVREALAQALFFAGLDAGGLSVMAGAGIAGAEHLESAARFEPLMAGAFTRFALRTDAYTSCLGAHGGEDGAVVAIGTGSVGYAIAGNETRRVGGRGFPHGDEGSGAWIGLRAVRIMLRAFDGLDRETRFAESLHAWLAQKCEDPMDWAINATATRFASLAPFVVDMARNGDADAQALMGQAGTEIGSIARALFSSGSGFSSLPLCLAGGLADVVKPFLPGEIQARLRACRSNAVDGALLLAQREFGWSSEDIH